ncbi:hypothetical protein [Xanthobacter versatilis]|uniref:hypothetical protein n=1 Tax=Xanthobacter autotrophicus (strain ATCC BAA-1158 / Py2) TaxID=78245 RepID=UPI00372BC284
MIHTHRHPLFIPEMLQTAWMMNKKNTASEVINDRIGAAPAVGARRQSSGTAGALP